jgi:hypothetical protein
MAPAPAHSRTAVLALYCALVAITILFGVPAKYAASVQSSMALAGIVIIGAAALRLGGPAILHGSEAARRLALAGLLLVAPWAVFAVMAGYGPPWAADSAQNHLRYKGLLLNLVLVGGGLTLLRDALAAAGERVWSALGFAATVAATPAYLVWGAIIMGSYLAHDHVKPGQIALEASPLGPASDVLLFLGGLLTYVATAAYAMSAYRAGWLKARSAAALVVLCGLAILALLVRGLEYPDASAQWYLAPGFIAGIPAIPWLMPFVLGVRCLRLAAVPH